MAFVPVRFTDTNKNEFASTLRKRVDAFFKEKNISKHANATMVIKTIILMSMYILPFIYLLAFHPGTGVSILLWTIMGLGVSGIGMSVMHDANHGAYSKNNTVNYWLGHTLNILGGSVFNWKMQHNVMHHTYTNIINYDDDIADKLILKFNPHTQVRWYHKLQFIYAFLFYGILTLYWAVLKDFVQFLQYKKQGVNTQNASQNSVTVLKIVLSKIVYWTLLFVIPIYFFDFSFVEILLGYLLMQFISGVILTVVFQLAHTVEGTAHPVPNADNTLETNWYVHQLATTVNFSRKSKFISWYVGGLNFQVEHHLFPTICHVHYPEISEIVKTTCEEYEIPYLENKTFGEALNSHVKAVIRFGKLPSMNEAIS